MFKNKSFKIDNLYLVNSISTAPMISFKRFDLRVPGIETIQGFYASTHASAIWTGVTFLVSLISLPESDFEALETDHAR
jgi:hypothetical protein